MYMQVVDYIISIGVNVTKYYRYIINRSLKYNTYVRIKYKEVQMSIDAGDFEYVYNNYNKIMDDVTSIPKEKRTLRQDKLLSDALLMDKLIFDSRHGG